MRYELPLTGPGKGTAYRGGQSNETTAIERQLELSLQQARYQVAHARRQYDAVDPANRLVAGELERRWNEALQSVARIEGEIAASIARRPPPLSEPEGQQLMALGADLKRAWPHPAARAATRKRILRAALSEVIVRRDGAIIHLVLHWQGGEHTDLKVKQRLNAAGRHNPRIPDDTIALMRELADAGSPDQRACSIASTSHNCRVRASAGQCCVQKVTAQGGAQFAFS